MQFKDPNQAVEAYLDNDNTIFQGRLLHIISAKAKKDTKLDDFEISKLPLKKQKEIRRKQDAVKTAFNWNSLYLNVCQVYNLNASCLTNLFLRLMRSCLPLQVVWVSVNLNC